MACPSHPDLNPAPCTDPTAASSVTPRDWRSTVSPTLASIGPGNRDSQQTARRYDLADNADLAALQAVLDTHPDLSDSGVNTPPAKRDAERKYLLSRVDEFTKICRWLAEFDPIKTPNTGVYWLKHLAEREVGYASNGAAIAASVHMQYPMRRYSDTSPNVEIAISQRQINIARKRTGF